MIRRIIRRVLAIRIWGYSVRRWVPTVLMLSVILTHAIASPFWYRIGSGTRVEQSDVVTWVDARDAVRRTAFSPNEEGSSSFRVRRSIQSAIDSEREGLTRAQARGAITLPVPSIFIEIPDLHIEGDDVRGHRFRCDDQREDCSVILQSTTYFVHILQGKDFIARTIINRPILTMRPVNEGVRITGFGFPGTQVFLDQADNPTERFSSVSTRLATTDGAVLDHLEFNSRHVPLLDFYKGDFISMAPFEPIDLTYTLDFSNPAANYFEKCRLFSSFGDNAAPDAVKDEDSCGFEIDDIAAFTLSQCDDTNGPCPSNLTDPVDDLKDHNFVEANLIQVVPMGFRENGANDILEIANRAIGNDSDTGLINLPNRIAIVEEIIIDYLTVTGFSAQSQEFEQLLAANPDLNVDSMRALLQQDPPFVTRESVQSALGRQPQLGVWQGYAQYIGPELLTGLARDLVKMGLARPY